MGERIMMEAMQGQVAAPAVAVKEFVDLYDLIEMLQTDCLNQKDEHPWQSMIKPGDDDMYCESNMDEQLLLNIGFRERVKIKGITFKCNAGGDSDAYPRDVKIFVNKR